jgi:hypothetical protein
MTAQAVIKDGRLLLPHDAGCGAELITPADPRYASLAENAVRDDALDGSAEQDASLADRWRAKWAFEDRRTA